MTTPEEIEQLKEKLATTADDREQAQVLVDLLSKYTSINSAEHQPYIEQLSQLADRMNSQLFRAWSFFYLGNLKRVIGEYDASLSMTQQALELFEIVGERKGMADAWSTMGSAYFYLNNYDESLRSQMAALKQREELGDKSGMAGSYNNIGMVYVIQGNLKEGLKKMSAARNLFGEIDNKRGVANCHNNMGNVYDRLGNYHEALENFFSALKLFDEFGSKFGVSNCYNNIGQAYQKQGNYPEALKYLFLALKLRLEISDKSGIANSYNNIGVVYGIQGNDSEALKNYRAGLKVFEESKDRIGISFTYCNIGNVYHGQGNFVEALKNHLASLQINEEIGNKSGVANSHANIGAIYLDEGNYADALNHLLKGLHFYKEVEEKQGVAWSYANIGKVHQKQGNHQETLENLFAALKLANEMKAQDLIKSFSLFLSDAYKDVADFESAFLYYQKYHDVEKEILGEESTKQLNNLSFMHNLEQKEKDLEIEHLRNVELKKERDRSESLLLNILPAEVAEELKEKGSADAKHFDDVTVLFTDFKGFTTASERLTPQQLVDELHACFSAFDNIMHTYGIEKIKTVGDAYLAVSGLPVADTSHAENMVNAAIDIREFMLHRKKELGDMTFEIRIGVHSGPVVAGIVGIKKFAYDIWGDTVNTAARMEQNSEAGRINISESTHELVKDKFDCQYRGEIDAKNKGRLRMYFVN